MQLNFWQMLYVKYLLWTFLTDVTGHHITKHIWQGQKTHLEWFQVAAWVWQRVWLRPQTRQPTCGCWGGERPAGRARFQSVCRDRESADWDTRPPQPHITWRSDARDHHPEHTPTDWSETTHLGKRKHTHWVSIHPSVYIYILHLSVHPSAQTIYFPNVYSSIQSLIHPSIHTPTLSSIYLFIHPLILL